nr:uncharacterized protein LOC124806853 isoform X2 [Hydra vulgaris]
MLKSCYQIQRLKKIIFLHISLMNTKQSSHCQRVLSFNLDSLKKIGGGKPREHVFLIMKRLFSNQLQSKLNRKVNGEKISLENLVNIWSVLRDIGDVEENVDGNAEI